MKVLRNRAVLFALLGCAISVFSVNKVYGQAGSASISGRIGDPSGAAVPDARISMKNTGTSATLNTASDSQGRYTVPDLPIGVYDMTVAKTGFQTAVRAGVVVTVNSQ